jgi:homospermidine synthase
VRAEKARNPGGTTAVSCCGANPGMVSWFVKQALLDVAEACGFDYDEPAADDRAGWAKLMKRVGIKGIHIAERDTQRSTAPKPADVFVNTWSVEGFISEGLQPAELGWGTHEKWMPKNAKTHAEGCGAAIFLEQAGAATRVRTWCPTPGPQFGFLVTHNESISIADYFTVRDKSGKVRYRPTCHYAYHPANNAVLSLHEMFGNGGTPQPEQVVMDEADIVDGIDELGRAALRPRQERLLVRLAAFHRRDARARARPERHGSSGDLGRARRHGLCAGEPGAWHRGNR